jgi:hypothetical protein
VVRKLHMEILEPTDFLVLLDSVNILVKSGKERKWLEEWEARMQLC